MNEVSSMNHSNPTTSTRINSSGHSSPPQQRYSPLPHTKTKAQISPTSFRPKKRRRESKDEGDNEKDITVTTTNEIDTTTKISNKITSHDNMKSGKGNDDGEEIVVRGMRLEAIFHPKFDNERNKKVPGKNGKGSGKKNDSSSDIRNAMLQKLGLGSGRCTNTGSDTVETLKGTGHLEVSLKHSGSLVLWSGSTRYYSKNSACNEFTRTAEILLRQRFETVRRAMVSLAGTDGNGNSHHCYRSYEDCSRFVSQNRYTIAFEVVTAEMLGDHGQIPHLDYVVVTAVADRSHERFLSTTEVLEFCHRYRLPHNDVWTFFPPSATEIICKGSSSAETLFQLYDNSLRETGYTENTVQALTEIADVYIPSPIPHSIFQGSICEGFIVRYVDDDVCGETAKERERLEGLAQTARTILKQVPPPPSSPTTISPDKSKCDSLLDVNLRALHKSISDTCKDENEKVSLSSIALQRQRAALFSETLGNLLQDETEIIESAVEGNDSVNERKLKRPRKRHDLRKIEKQTQTDRQGDDKCNSAPKVNMKSSRSLRSYHLPTLTKDLLESKDKETKRIARLLQTLDGLKGGAVTYTWMEKEDGAHNESSYGPNKTRSNRQIRLYCIIHVLNDSTFFKFQSVQKPSEMTLFRGFCVEVLLSSSDTKDEEQINWGGKENRKSSNEGGTDARKEDEGLWRPHSRTSIASYGESGTPLMLKMKLLPYMVRTFICRNLMKTIHQKGPEEFERLALGLLEKWKMSSDAQERWMPFFRGWALYVMQYKAEEEEKDFQIKEKQNPNDSKATKDFKEHAASVIDKLMDLGPLTNFSYLRHLEHFTKLYESGKFHAAAGDTSSPEFQTFVCIISQSTEVSLALAKQFANYLNVNESRENAASKMTVCSVGEATKNRRSKSCIAYANVRDVTKGIKKFICDKKLAKRSIFILFASNKDEIIALTRSSAVEGADGAPEETRALSWMEIPTEGEGKKLVNMWKLWKKFPCAKRVELGRDAVEIEPKREGSSEAVIASVSGTQDIIDTIQGVGRSLIQQEIKKHSDPNRGGILVFFPGIPGCGKSSLVGSSRSKLEEEMESLTKEKGDLYDRSIHLKEGDKIGKNFWNIIEDLLSDDSDVGGKSPPLVIADKNAPPASWPKLGHIAHDSNGIMLPILPDSSVMETTTIEGSILPDGTLLPHASHFYPFSLKFLAVSLSRVLSRPPGEHAGKLDSGFPMACMVVVQFFSFYRYIGADTFQEKLNEKFDKDGSFSIKILKPVELPFLTTSARDQNLPDDLKNLLEEALQLRHGHDKSKIFKVKKDDPQMIDLEGRLRSSIEEHKETIRTMTVNLENAKEAFALQIMDQMKSLSNKIDNIVEPTTTNSSSEKDISENVKLVSLDIERIKVHKLLEKFQESGALKNFFDSIKSLSPSPLPLGEKNEDNDTVMTDENGTMSKLGNGDSGGVTTERYPGPCFIEKTHVTMAFAGEKNLAKELISNFRHLQGQEVTISVTGFLWNSTNAALAIKISPSTNGNDSISIPPCENSFPHITVWCAPDVKASLSNQLPNLVESGKASHVDFAREELLVGKLSFWNHDNEPFTV